MRLLKLKAFLLSLATLSLLLAPNLLLAANLNDAMGTLSNAGKKAGTGDAKVESVVGSIINAALSMVGLIFLVLMVYGGFLWMTARGEESNIEKAQKIISAAVIGLVVIMAAYAITFFVTSRLEAAA